MSYNVAEYVFGCLFGDLLVGEGLTDLSQTVFVWSTNVTYTHTHTHTHTHTNT